MASVRIFHVESPSPQDVLASRAEGPLLVAIGPLLGHQVHSQIVYSKGQLREVVNFLGEMPTFNDPKKHRAVVLHVSAHGLEGGGGLAFGPDRLDWAAFAALLRPFVAMSDEYPGKRIVVLSACYADQQKMTENLAKSGRSVPVDYLFCTENDVDWHHAAVAWMTFYYLLPDLDLDSPKSVKGALGKILGLGTKLHYWRWDKNKRKYLRHSPSTGG